MIIFQFIIDLFLGHRHSSPPTELEYAVDYTHLQRAIRLKASYPTLHYNPYIPAFPTEIYERIIDFLWSDRRSLLACALTCRAWLPRSRYILFYCTELWNSDQIRRFCSLVDASPYLAYLVRELNICPYPLAQFKLFEVFPSALAGKLLSVESLRIGGAHRPKLHLYPISQHFATLMSQFTSVSTLTLGNMEFSSVTDFGRLVCSLPCLSNLTCGMLSWTTNQYNPLALGHSGPRRKLKHLTMAYVPWSGDMANWLLDAASVTYIESIELFNILLEDVEHIGRGLEAVGSSLHHLAFSYHWQQRMPVSDREPETYRPLMRAAIRLNSILFSLTRLYYGSERERKYDHKGWGWVHAALSQVSSYCIEQMTIRFPSHMEHTDLAELRCDRIDELLSRAQFASLKRFVIELPHWSEKNPLSRLHTELTRRFPLSYARNIMRFENVTAIWSPWAVPL
ncbi:hypothetical protein AcW1_002478 [Taiwanofungus camphoratus]|nr:hypothetical protein AcV7_005459 [Antrodia cinnamomea]KAI0943269.1 hypothetical protein AcW1_002478 [Antrodia cinnamomea]